MRLFVLRSLVACATVIGLATVACGPASYENVAACKEGVAKVNALECTADDFLDPAEQCPDSWDEVGIDYTDYIDCLFGQYSCDETGTYVFTDGSCTIPTE